MDIYQEWTRETAKYPKGVAEFEPSVAYLALGLAGEAGEVANKYKKVIRDKSGIIDSDGKKDLVSELGDVLWYVARLADELGYSLEAVATLNIDKLQGRVVRGTIGGSGDYR